MKKLFFVIIIASIVAIMMVLPTSVVNVIISWFMIITVTAVVLSLPIVLIYSEYSECKEKKARQAKELKAKQLEEAVFNAISDIKSIYMNHTYISYYYSYGKVYVNCYDEYCHYDVRVSIDVEDMTISKPWSVSGRYFGFRDNDVKLAFYNMANTIFDRLDK